MTTRYRGIVQTGDVVLVRLRVDGAVVASHTTPGMLTVELADGSALQLEVPASVIVDGEGVSTRGAWGELRELPEARGLARELEQPFTDVELVRVAVVAGTAIEVCGDQVDVAFAADGGPREAPSEVPIVRAELLAAGPQAGPLIDELLARRREAEALRHPAPRRVKPTDPGDPATPGGFSVELMLVLTIGATCLGLGSVMGQLHWRTAIAPLIALAGAAFAARSDRSAPSFWRRSEVVERRDLTALAMILMLLAAALCAVAGDQLSGRLALAYEIFPVGVAVLVVTSHAGTYRLLAELVRAQRRPLAEAAGEWLAVEGVVRPGNGGAGKDGVLVRAQTRIILGVGRHTPDKVDERKVTGAKAFGVVADDGSLVAIERDDILWASTAGITGDREGGFAVTNEDHIANGDRVVAAGKLVRESTGKLALRSAGTRPVVVLVTSDAGRPLALARTLVAIRRNSLIGLAITATGIAASALLVR